MKITMSRFAATAMMFAIFTLPDVGLAHAEGIPPQCANTITACGCTIGASGNYQLGNDVFASQGLTLKSGCIDIEGSHINLTVNHNIFGTNTECGDGGGQSPQRRKLQPDTGIGIHVLPGAANVAVYAVGQIICGWNYGVESESNNVDLFELKTISNNVGMFLNNATDNSCQFCDSERNSIGLRISGGSANTINGGVYISNEEYGLWVDGSQHNMLTSDGAAINGSAGIYLGCSSTANVKPQIPCTTETTTKNSIVGNVLQENGKYGIAVERESFYNNIEDNDSRGNTTKDMIDGNANCVYNNYQLDTLTTKSPKCIQ
jgi:hypothetical protein